MHRRTLIAAVAAAAALSLTACSDNGGAAPDGDYPVNQIRFVVPYAAGSGPDASARVIAKELEKELGATVVVENIDAGRGLAGLYEIARGKPDGSTIGWGAAGSIGINAHLIPDSPFKGIDTLTPIARTKLVPNVLFASPDKGWNSIEDFVKEAKANPGELTVGLPEPGSSQAIQFGLLTRAAEIDVKTINYPAGEMILPAVNGTVDASVAQIGPVVQYVDSGKLQFVATLGGNAPEGLDVASADDAGYNTAEYQGWEGVFGPAGMDHELVATLSDAVKAAVASKAYQRFSATTYGLAAFADHEEFATIARQAYENGPDIIERFDLKAS